MRTQEVLISGDGSRDFDSTGKRRKRPDGSGKIKAIPDRMDSGGTGATDWIGKGSFA